MSRILQLTFWLFLALSVVSRTWKFFDPGIPQDKMIGGVIVSAISIGIWFYLAIQCRSGTKSSAIILTAFGAVSLAVTSVFAALGESPMSLPGVVITIVHNAVAVALGLIALVEINKRRVVR